MEESWLKWTLSFSPSLFLFLPLVFSSTQVRNNLSQGYSSILAGAEKASWKSGSCSQVQAVSGR